MKTRILGYVAVAAVIGAAINGLFIVPADLNQGDAQRIMYVHVPSACLHTPNTLRLLNPPAEFSTWRSRQATPDSR